MTWPDAPRDLEALQRELALLRPEPWVPTPAASVGGCFVCFGRGGGGPGEAGERGWAAAVRLSGVRLAGSAVVDGGAGAPYVAGLLASREGPLLESAVRALRSAPAVVVVNATGRDHPRQAGLALHLGWVLDLPTVGVTDRPLVASGDAPDRAAGSASPLVIEGEQIGWWARTRAGARPVAVSPGWAIDLDTALEVVLAVVGRFRTPEPIRQARRLARAARSREQEDAGPAGASPDP
ncbi:MAG: endonuclease V [Acidimicrobiia bacterium]|jgi:deoxyribonuclease V